MTTAQRKQYLHKFTTALVAGSSEPDNDITQCTISFGRDRSLSSSLSVDYTAFAETSRIPLTCLQGIWNKAAELIATEGAIVPAPGCDDGAKFVLSYRGKKPHLVTPKKSDLFACDSDCPNWKGLGICAHSVAVAELGGKLNNFVGKMLKAKKTPMISKFAEATMPKGRGRKGGETNRKRKASVAVDKWLPNPSFIEQDSWSTSFFQSPTASARPPHLMLLLILPL